MNNNNSSGNNSGGGDDGNGSSGSVTSLAQVPPSACSVQCKTYQQVLVECVDSIRAANSSNSRTSSTNDSDGDEVEESKVETPTCLPVAVSEWTKCCTEANLRDRKEHDEEDVDTSSSSS